MKTRLVIQENEETGETNLHFFTDPITRPEDCLLRGKGWDPSKYTVETLLIEGTPEAVEALTRYGEFRSVTNSDGEHGNVVVVDGFVIEEKAGEDRLLGSPIEISEILDDARRRSLLGPITREEIINDYERENRTYR